MVESPVRFALKVDVDTFRGMREGLPRLMDLLAARGIRSSVFVSMGPDHSGRAIRRLFTRRGFLGKMIKTNAVSIYGPRTLLYGTLLPGPMIARRNAPLFRRLEDEGHETGIHGWDHVRWQDGLPRFDEGTIEQEIDKALGEFLEITGRGALACAAPGWIANARSLAVQDRRGFVYSSDVRGSHPFRPRIGDRTYRTLQIPTTLPTLDEMIGRRELFEEVSAGGERPGARGIDPGEAWINRWLIAECRRQAAQRPDGPIVHTIHAEVEGLSRSALIEDLLDRLGAEGARFVRLDEVAGAPIGPGGGGEAFVDDGAAARLASGAAAPVGAAGRAWPVCEVREGRLAGRSGKLAVQAAR